MTTMTTRFAARLNEAIRSSGITKYRLAKDAGVSEGLVSQFASGKQLPSDKTIAKLAVVLGIDEAELMAVVMSDRIGVDALARLVAHEVEARLVDVGSVTNRNGDVGLAGTSAGHNQPSTEGRPGVEMVQLPRYGPLAAGDPPMFAATDATEMVSLPARWAEGADGIFKVCGNSLSGRRIRDGDELVVARLDGRRPPSGSIVVVAVEGSYVARIYRNDEVGEDLWSHVEGEEPKRHRYPDDSQVVGRVLRFIGEP